MTEIIKKSKMSCAEIRNSPGLFATRIYNYLFIEDAGSTVIPESYIDRLTELLDSLPTDNMNPDTSMPKKFSDKIWGIKKMLNIDLDAFFVSDPAAHSKDEIRLAYPGFYALSLHRMAHLFYEEGNWLFARLIAEYAHRLTGIDIHPGASIESGFFIDHGTGIVIGETAVVGENVKIFQGVTLGALSVLAWMAPETKAKAQDQNPALFFQRTFITEGMRLLLDSVVKPAGARSPDQGRCRRTGG